MPLEKLEHQDGYIYPCFKINLTQEEFEKIKDRKLEIYYVDNKNVFDVKNTAGEVVGKTFFVVALPNGNH